MKRERRAKRKDVDWGPDVLFNERKKEKRGRERKRRKMVRFCYLH